MRHPPQRNANTARWSRIIFRSPEEDIHRDVFLDYGNQIVRKDDRDNGVQGQPFLALVRVCAPGKALASSLG
jgi:hypothetical protein